MKHRVGCWSPQATLLTHSRNFVTIVIGIPKCQAATNVRYLCRDAAVEVNADQNELTSSLGLDNPGELLDGLPQLDHRAPGVGSASRRPRRLLHRCQALSPKGACSL